jgi:hypothetical protein
MQRFVLWWLEDSLDAKLGRAFADDAGRWFAAADIARGHLDYVQREALRRAVTTLAARGLVEVERRPHGWYCRLPQGLSVGKEPTLRTPGEARRLVNDLQVALERL